MKSLNKFINEAYNNYRLDEVKVVYDIITNSKKELWLTAPSKFSESDIQLYIDDTLINQLPCGAKLSKEFFGKNCDNISDAYFQYESFEHIQENYSGHIDIPWDDHYAKAENLDYFKIKNMQFVIVFDRFDVLDGNDDNIKETLDNIFKRTESSNINNYPIDIIYNPELLNFRK